MPLGQLFRRNRGPLPYTETTQDEYAHLVARTFTTTEPQPGTLILSGPCPRCSALIDIPVITEVFRAARPQGDPNIHPMACTCDEDHPGRRDDLHGCGAYWTMVVPR